MVAVGLWVRVLQGQEGKVAAVQKRRSDYRYLLGAQALHRAVWWGRGWGVALGWLWMRPLPRRR